MATSDVIICNLALSSIGKDTINSIDEDSEAAIQCNLHIEHVRTDLLRSNHDWSHARKSQALARVTNSRTDWTYCYDLPSDFVKIIKPTPYQPISAWEFAALPAGSLDIASAPYMIANGKIYSNILDPVLRYVFDQTDRASYPQAFVFAMWNALAARIVFALTKDEKRQQRVEQKAYGAVLQAEASDANSDENTTEFIPSHISARSA